MQVPGRRQYGQATFPSRDELAETAELCRRAILTITHLPDREQTWLRKQTSTLDVIRTLEEAYGYDDARRPPFRPTARDVDNCLIVMGWLAALKHEPHPGNRDYKIIWARAFNCPWHKLAAKHGRSDKTMQRWYEHAIAHVTLKYRRVKNITR